VNFATTIWPRLFVRNDIVSKPITSILARFEYAHFLSNWAKLFDKLQRALTRTLLARWMYSFWLRLTTFHCFYVIESWASSFDKLLRPLTSFDLSSTFQVNMEWLMLQGPLDNRIS